MPLVLEPPRHGGLSSIALVPGRHLVGAAADCAIRLEADGIHDRHAMILVGENRTVVKAIDSRTWVNDGPVSEMALRAGDRLSIGPITFRVRAAAKDELVAFENRESSESVERSELLTSKSGHDEGIRPLAVAALVGVPVAAITNTASADGPRQESHEAEVVVERARSATVSAVSAATLPEVPPLSSGLTDVGDNPEIGSSARPAVHVVAHATLDPEPDFRTTEDSALERRLDEIQKRLADLGQAEFSFVSPPETRVSRPERGITRTSIESQLELTARTEQLARETTELQQRIEKVAEREALLEQRQLGLVQEAERIAQVAEIARQTLADEHAEHFSIWQEWEGTFQRLTSDLAAQLSAFERQRDAFKQETQRFQAAQIELRNARADLERERQTQLADRIKLQNEIADLNSLRSQQDRLHFQHQRDLDEQTIRLELERKRLQDERAEIATLKIDLLRQRQVLDLDRSQFDVKRTGMEESLRDLQVRCQRAESDLTQWRQQQEAESLALAQSRDNETGRLRELQDRLDDAWRQLQSEQDKVTQLRRELEIAQQSQLPVTLLQLDPFSPATPATGGAERLGNLAQEATASGQGVNPEVGANPSISATEFDSDASAPPASQSNERIWAVGPDVERNDTSSTTEIPRDWNSSESFGVSVDWTALAAIEQAFGEGPGVKGEGHPLEVGEQSVQAALPDQDRNGPGIGESSLTVSPVIPPVWPQQTIWPVTMPPFDGGRIDNQALVVPAATAKISAKASQKVDDPWAEFSGSAPNLATSSPAASLDELLNTGMGVVSEQNPAHSHSGFSAGPFFNSQDLTLSPNEAQDVRETLEEVNREFGMAVPESVSDESKTSLPAWWVEDAKAESRNDETTGESGKPSWVLDALRGTSGDQQSVESKACPGESSEPANQLRSQLAMLFELPAQPPSETSEHLTERDTESRSVETSVVRAEVNSDAITESSPAQGEDSVEAFMARLLARSRTGGSDADNAVTPLPAPATAAVRPAQANADSHAVRTEASIPGDHDRSHLMQGPKHKQDRQAVRENLQSFRQVAHLSARSALAKHSIQQLRNATIAKGVLLAASGLATIWFFGEPLVGRPLQLWKGSACGLALILSVIEFSRSWRQLMKPIRVATASSCDLEATDAGITAESTEAPMSKASAEPIGSDETLDEAPGAATDSAAVSAAE